MLLLTHLGCLNFLIFAFDTARAIEPFVVGGDYAKIEKYPHSAFLTITCRSAVDEPKERWICGASIVNQNVLLTAGHCLENCIIKKSTNIAVSTGNANRAEGYKSKAVKFVIHENYNPINLNCDIALLQVAKPIKFGSQMKRVLLLKKTPFNEVGDIAGWGLIDDVVKEGTLWLKHVKQKIWKRRDCLKYLSKVPQGCICGGDPKRNSNYAAEGDSGAALMVRGFIQIGLVSYKVPSKARGLSVYTEVAYYYDWIQKTINLMYCNRG